MNKSIFGIVQYLVMETALILVQFKSKKHAIFQAGDFYLFKVFQTLKIKRKRMKNKKYLLNDQKMRNKSLSCTTSELLMMRIKLENDQSFEKLGLGSCPCNKKKTFLPISVFICVITNS